MNVFEVAAKHQLVLVPTGSRVICNPPVLDTDADYAAYAEQPGLVITTLDATGWVGGGSIVGDGFGDGWESFRRGEENLILFTDRLYYEAFVVATEIAKALNLLRKEDRIKLFTEITKRWPRPKPSKVAIDDLDELFN